MSPAAPRRPAPARRIAADVLRDVLRGDTFSNVALARHLERHPALPQRDRAFATTLVYGVLRHLARLDALIDACAHRPRALSPRGRDLLRIAAFELRELAQPPHAAVSQAVSAARALRGGAGLVRAVGGILDRLAREGDALDALLEGGRPLDALARRWSVPRWWAGRWLADMSPEDALRRARALLQTPPLELRVCTRRATVAQALRALRDERPHAQIEPLPAPAAGLRVRGGGELFHGATHGAGLVWVQAAASQLPVGLLDPRPGEVVLDLCAGQGTKTRQIADHMGQAGELWALEPNAPRRARLERLADDGAFGPGDLTLVVRHHDATRPLPPDMSGRFDAVLVDAPCTGLGEVARHPEIKWRRRFQDIAARAAVQAQILRTAAGALRPGGRLVYAVCSLEPEEGPEVVARVTATGALHLTTARTWTPEGDGADGFYVALLRRSGSSAGAEAR